MEKALSEYSWPQRVAVAIAIANGVYEAESEDVDMPDPVIDFPDLCKWFFESKDPAKLKLQALLAEKFIGQKWKPKIVAESLPGFVRDARRVVAEIKAGDGYSDREVIDVATAYYGLGAPERNIVRSLLVEDRWRDQLRVGIFHLRKESGDPIDPLALTLTAWPRCNRDLQVVDFDDFTDQHRRDFEQLHALACKALSIPVFKPEMCNTMELTFTTMSARAQAQKSAGLAMHSQADAMAAFARRKFGAAWQPEVTHH